MGWAVGNGGGGSGFAPGAPPGSGWTTLLDTDFSGMALANPVTKNALNAEFGELPSSGSYTPLAIVDREGSRQLRWFCPANVITNQVAIFFRKLLTDYQNAHGTIEKAALEYDIEFDDAFSWSLGGKIPGLGGSRTSANPPTGGAGPTADGWSGRGMWRGPGSGTYLGRRALAPNEWVSYHYCWDQIYPGENQWSSRIFAAGDKVNVRQEYEMNSVISEGVSANADGINRMFWDGELVNEHTTRKWRVRSDLGCNVLLLHFFRGGNDDSWAAPSDGYIYLDNLKIEVKA